MQAATERTATASKTHLMQAATESTATASKTVIFLTDNARVMPVAVQARFVPRPTLGFEFILQMPLGQPHFIVDPFINWVGGQALAGS